MPRWVKYIEGPWSGRSEPDNDISARRIQALTDGGTYVEDPNFGTFTYDGLPARVYVWRPQAGLRQRGWAPEPPIDNA